MCSLLTALLYGVTAAQVALYVVALWQSGWAVEQLARNPLVGPSETRLHALGSLATSDLTDLRQYWRLASSIFLCSGAPHLYLPYKPLQLPGPCCGVYFFCQKPQDVLLGIGCRCVVGGRGATEHVSQDTSARPALSEEGLLQPPILSPAEQAPFSWR